MKGFVFVIGLFILFTVLSNHNKTKIDVTKYDKVLTSDKTDYVGLIKILEADETYAVVGHFIKDEKVYTAVFLTDDFDEVNFASVDNMMVLPGAIIEDDYMAFDGVHLAYIEYTSDGSNLCNWHLYDTSSGTDVIVDSAAGHIRDKQNPRVFFYKNNLIYERIDKTDMKTDICSYNIKSKNTNVLYSFISRENYTSYGIDVIEQYLVASVNQDGLSLLKYDLSSDEKEVITVEEDVDTVHSVTYAEDRSEILYYGTKNNCEEVAAVDSDGNIRKVYRLSESDMVNNEDLVYRDGILYLKLVKWKDPISARNYTLKSIDISSKEEKTMNRVGDITVTNEGMLLLYYPENTTENIDVYDVYQ